MMRQTAYYAHCVAIYDTPQENRDLSTLHSLGFDIYNPNSQAVAAMVERRKQTDPTNYMDLFRELIIKCDVFAFRALPDGRIPAGVYKELEYAKQYGKPIFELPSNILGRYTSVEETREYLQEVGQR